MTPALPPDPPEELLPEDALLREELLLRLLDEASAHADSAATHAACETYRLPLKHTRGFCAGIPHMGPRGGEFGGGNAFVVPQQYCACSLLADDCWLLLAAEKGGHAAAHAATESYRLVSMHEMGKPMSVKHAGGAPAIPGARTLYPQQYRRDALLTCDEERPLLSADERPVLLDPPVVPQTTVVHTVLSVAKTPPWRRHARASNVTHGWPLPGARQQFPPAPALLDDDAANGHCAEKFCPGGIGGLQRSSCWHLPSLPCPQCSNIFMQQEA